MTGFTKLFGSLVHSTVWREEMHVKVVWITMLALADRNGNVAASLPGLADAARVSIPQCEEALARLAGPDPYSRTKEHEGRRLEAVDGGWHLFNYGKYRELRSADTRREQTRVAVRKHREKCKQDVSNVSNVSHGKPKQKQKHRAEAETTALPDGSRFTVQPYADIWRKLRGDPPYALLTECMKVIEADVGRERAEKTLFAFLRETSTPDFTPGPKWLQGNFHKYIPELLLLPNGEPNPEALARAGVPA